MTGNGPATASGRLRWKISPSPRVFSSLQKGRTRSPSDGAPPSPAPLMAQPACRNKTAHLGTSAVLFPSPLHRRPTPCIPAEVAGIPPYFPLPLSHSTGGPSEAAVCRATPPVHPSETSHVRPPARTCESGNGFLYSYVGRAIAWHTAMSRGPGPKTPVTARERAFLPAPIKEPRKQENAVPHACPGPFFTISPLQPSSRGYYELYQGRCLEISCGAPPR